MTVASVLHYFFAVLENGGDGLEVEAVEGVAGGSGFDLDDIVFQSPVAALEGDDIVDLLEELGDGRVGLEGNGEDDASLGQSVATHNQQKAETVAGHGGPGTPRQSLEAIW